MGLTKNEKYARSKTESSSFKMIETRKAKRETCFDFYFSFCPPRFMRGNGDVEDERNDYKGLFRWGVSRAE